MKSPIPAAESAEQVPILYQNPFGDGRSAPAGSMFPGLIGRRAMDDVSAPCHKHVEEVLGRAAVTREGSDNGRRRARGACEALRGAQRRA